MFMLHLSPARHYVPTNPPPIAGYLKRAYPDRSLFVYFHRFARNWVVAEWVNRAKGTAIEVVILGKAPTFASRFAALDLRCRLRQPQNRRDIRGSLEALERHRRRVEEDERAEREDALKQLIRDAHPGPGARPFLWVPVSVGVGR